jgi:hypothetical protein
MVALILLGVNEVYQRDLSKTRGCECKPERAVCVVVRALAKYVCHAMRSWFRLDEAGKS